MIYFGRVKNLSRTLATESIALEDQLICACKDGHLKLVESLVGSLRDGGDAGYAPPYGYQSMPVRHNKTHVVRYCPDGGAPNLPPACVLREVICWSPFETDELRYYWLLLALTSTNIEVTCPVSGSF